MRPNPLFMFIMPGMPVMGMPVVLMMSDMPGIIIFMKRKKLKLSSNTVTNLQLQSVMSDMLNPTVATMATARESHPFGSELRIAAKNGRSELYIVTLCAPSPRPEMKSSSEQRECVGCIATLCARGRGELG